MADTTTSTTSANMQSLGDLAKTLGIDLSQIQQQAQQPGKSGTTTRTYTTTNIPNDLALKQKINQVFKQFYGRDASELEIQTWLPQLKQLYTTPDGKTRTTVSETYKDNKLVSTSYKTADNLDPSVWLQDKIKEQVQIGRAHV